MRVCVLGFVLGCALVGTVNGAVVIETEEYDCANTVETLRDLLIEDNRDAPTYGLLRQTLTQKLAKKCGVYVVQLGDTLSAIAERFNTTARELMRLNPELGGHGYRLELYQVIRIRNIEVEEREEKTR